MKKIKGRKTSIQSHAILAMRYQAMARAVYHGEMSEEERRRYNDLEEQAQAHKRKASLFKDVFTMIL